MKNTIYLFVFTLIFITISCVSENSPSPEEILTSGRWVMSQTLRDDSLQGDYFDITEECWLDDFVEYFPEGTGTYTRGNVSCTSSENTGFTFLWSMSEDQNFISNEIIENGFTRLDTSEIVELTEDLYHLRNEYETPDGTPYIVDTYYIKE